MAKGCFIYDWTKIQLYYADGHGYLECREKFRFAKTPGSFKWITATA